MFNIHKLFQKLILNSSSITYIYLTNRAVFALNQELEIVQYFRMKGACQIVQVLV